MRCHLITLALWLGGCGSSRIEDTSSVEQFDAASGAQMDGGTVRNESSSYAVFEQDFTPQEGSHTNPWEDVTVSMVVTSPSGRATKIGGFYHSGTTYRARFRPDEAGAWIWSATIADAKSSVDRAGKFDAVPDGGRRFIRRSADNPNRWKYEDGEPYYGLGLQAYMPKVGGLDSPGGNNGGLYVAAGQAVNLDTFLKTNGSAGMNMFRWTLDNWTPGLWQTISPGGNVYLVAEGLDGDRIVTTARKYGFSILFTFFNYWVHPPPNFGSATLSADQTKALQRYVQYLVNRYSAYIDIWEAVNEGNGSAAWYAAIIPYLKENDPYHHDVTTSTVFALGSAEYQAGVTLNMMHWYAPLTEGVAAKWTYDNLQQWKAAGLAGAKAPNTIVGETGNCCKVCNYDPTGFRLRNWAAFFGEGILIYWDDTATKTNCGTANTAYYIGDEERASAKVLQDFSRGFDPKAKIDTTLAVTGKAMGYGLRGPLGYAAFLEAADHTAPTTGITIKITPMSAGHATWIDPKTGQTLAELDVPQGQQVLSVPSFTTDIALKIVGG
jgi:Domain of unknown function (DUF5060)